MKAIRVAGKQTTVTKGQQYSFNHTVNQTRKLNGVRHK